MWHVELETAEVAAFETMYRCAPPLVQSALKLAVAHLGPVTAFAAGASSERMFNRAVWVGLANPAEVIPALFDFYRSQGSTRFWLQLAEPLLEPDLLRHITAAGGIEDPIRWAKFSCDRAPVLPETAAELVTVGPAEAADFARIAATAFGMPDILLPWIEAFAVAPHVHAYLACIDGVPAAAGLYHETDGAAWLGLGSTLPSHRRHGLQGALLARRIGDALAAGNRWAVSEIGVLPDRDNPSLRNIGRSGLQLRYLRPNYQFNL